jgi:hypothetical protein
MKINRPNAANRRACGLLSFAAIALALAFRAANAHAAAVESEKIAQDELVRRTQQLVDAVAIGDQSPWKMYFADDAIFLDETGHGMGKAALVANITPLPKGYSGTIKIANAQSRIYQAAAVLAYDLNETEVVFGQKLNARYHETDTWLWRNGRWQIVAGQVLRYYADPAPGQIEPARLQDYVGTYQLAPGVTLTVLREGNLLYSKRGDGPKTPLVPEVADLFFRPGLEGRRLFRRNASGKVDGLIDRRNNEDLFWKKL